jgi:hypothetical protein
MRDEVTSIDVSASPELARLADAVRQQRKPVVLRRGAEELAVLSPVEPPTVAPKRPRRRRQARSESAWILGLADLGSSEGPNDTSVHKQRYLAEAYAPKPGSSKAP